jgi:hypothetical protein
MSNPWISQVKHQDPTTDINVGSPTLVKLDSGELLAAHDYQGKGINRQFKGDRYTTSVYRSDDNGLNWKLTVDLQGSIWATLFVNRGSVYLLGTSSDYGSIVIRRSEDGGSTWTIPADEGSGLLFRGGYEYGPPNYHHSPNNVLQFEGRLYTAYENDDPFDWPAGFRAFVLSADEDSDLLKASSWRKSNEVPFPRNLPYKVDGWLEGNIVVDHDGRPCSVLRLQPELPEKEYFSSETKFPIDKAAFLRIENEGRQLVNDLDRWFIDLPGAMSKFTIRWDDIGSRYWLLANDMSTGPPRVHRNILSLFSSPDLSSWTKHTVLMEDRHEKTPNESAKKTGFQYPDWQFDGDDIIYLVRTAYRGAPNYHDANRITFGRIVGFREISQMGGSWHTKE